MKVPGFVGPTYTVRASTLDTQRCINLYAEIDEAGTGKDGNVMALLSTPGLELHCTISGGPIRGMYTASNGKLYVCSGDGLYAVSAEGNALKVASIGSAAGKVSIADNGTFLAVVDGSSGYWLKLSTGDSGEITDPDFLGANTVAVLDGYFIFNKPNTGSFYILRPGSTDFDVLDFATAEAKPDKLLGIFELRQQLWLFGQTSIEVFYNSGDPDLPFSRMSGGVMDYGCASAQTVSVLDNTIYWLGVDERGSGVVYAANGYQPIRISTHAIEYLLQRAGSLSSCSAFTYQQEGHHFYVLHVPSMNITLVYDGSTKLWHERAYTDQNSGELERHRAECYAYAHGYHYVGDYVTGNVYKLKLDVYTDNGDFITRMRTSPHMAGEMRDLFFNEFQVDIEVGVGVDEGGQGADPQAMLQWSSDGGRTWSSERWKTIGPLGTYKTRVRWLRLGRARDRVWRLKITDPVKVAILGAYVDVVGGTS